MKIRKLLVVVTLGAVSCGGGLPRYAEPQGGRLDPDEIQERDLIPYRELKPSDFLAEEPPEDMRPYAERMGALTCAKVFTEPEPQFYVEETAEGFRGAFTSLAFVARMDRDCSWWNPKELAVPVEYVLQHEQIHFALSEITARKLNAKSRDILENLVITGNSSEKVQTELRDVVSTLMDDGIDELMDRNLEFDRDTSNTYAPELQQRWYDEVMGELAE